MMKQNLRVLSLGAGVQSSALALMIEHGEIPMVDCAIFADTGAEPQKVYEWLEYIKSQVSYPVHVVQWRNLKEDLYSAAKGEYKGFTAPFHTRNRETGKTGILMRQCTHDYKIKPVLTKIRELLGLKKGQKVKPGMHVEQIMGISWDEMQRQKVNRLPYITNVYPLIERQMRRHNCINWMEEKGYPKPPRSACTFCPFRSNIEWRAIQENPKEWAEVLEIDEMIRDQEKFKKNKDGSKKFNDDLYLHKSAQPLKDVDLRSAEEKGQYSLLDECEGMCGI